jgi:PIN domain nuclease of toxin-antitoxin system
LRRAEQVSASPFDRLLIAQAKREGCAILTKDTAFAAYGVPVVW